MLASCQRGFLIMNIYVNKSNPNDVIVVKEFGNNYVTLTDGRNIPTKEFQRKYKEAGNPNEKAKPEKQKGMF